jgi:hypothetical protein
MLNGRKTEARRLRQQVEDEIEWLLPMLLLHPVEGDFDRKRAALEALNNLRAEEARDHRLAEKILQNKGKARRIRRLPKNAVEEFFSWAEFVIGFTLSKEEGLRMFEELRRKPATKSGRSRRKTSA